MQQVCFATNFQTRPLEIPSPLGIARLFGYIGVNSIQSISSSVVNAKPINPVSYPFQWEQFCVKCSRASNYKQLASIELEKCWETDDPHLSVSRNMVQRGAVSGDASIWLKENWLPGEVRDSLCASLIWDLQLDTLSKSQIPEEAPPEEHVFQKIFHRAHRIWEKTSKPTWKEVRTDCFA
ncbi:hypothetical protein Peur_068911 [Populus x canadensis]